MRRTAIAAIALAGFAASPVGASDPQIGRILEAGMEPAANSAVLRITVGPNARTTGCAVERSSGSAETDAAACRYFTRRGEWRSRRDSEGRRVGYEMAVEVFREFLGRVAELAR